MAPRGSSAWRREEWGPGCDPSVIVAAYWIPGAPRIQCHRDSVGAWRALGRVLRRHRYVVRPEVTGCYVCRKITGGTAPSSHAPGIGRDVNWDTNPYRTDRLVTDMPRPMIEEGEAIVTRAGVKVFRWGGDWDGRPETPHSNYDGMHWEIIATPEELQAGFDVGEFDEEDRWTWPLLGRGERGNAVRQLQGHLATALSQTAVADGIFGQGTEDLVRRYQATRGLDVDGLVSLATWTALFSGQPPLPPGAPRPTKSPPA
jgi:hypothetical protein